MDSKFCHHRTVLRLILMFLLACCVRPPAAAAGQDFVPLFNGRDLSGWVNVNCAPETWAVRDGMIHCTGKPTGALRTPRQYENFILELEWRHLSNGGNSGVFIWSSPIAAPGGPFLRSIEVQVLDNGYDVKGRNEWYTTHGDVFPIHGSTMNPFGRHNGKRSFPSEERSKSSPEWNHYRVVCTNGVIHLHVNGKQVSGGENCNYRKGYIGLESEGGPIDFRNIRIKELPSSNASPEVTAPTDDGYRSLFTGIDLRGWQTASQAASRWQVNGERLQIREQPANEARTLWTTAEFGDVEVTVDCHPGSPAKGQEPAWPEIQLRGCEDPACRVRLIGNQPDKYQRFVISVKGREVIARKDGEVTQRLTLGPSVPLRGALGLSDTGSGAEFMNLYVRER